MVPMAPLAEWVFAALPRFRAYRERSEYVMIRFYTLKSR
jgi:hypothetical protein